MYVYLPKFNKQMHYYDTYRSTMGIFFTVKVIICFGTKYYANLEIISCQVLFYQPLHTSRSEDYLESTVQNTFFCALLVCLAQHPSAFTSRRRTDKAGRGALGPPPEEALERSDLTA